MAIPVPNSNVVPNNMPRPLDAKFIGPTLKLKDPVMDSLQFHQDKNSSSLASSRGNLSKRFLHPMSLDAKEVNYKINVPNFANLPPLQLGSKFITDLNKIDSMTPSDLYYGETLNKAESGLDNYYFDYENGLGEFSRFEKINQLSLPDKFFDEYNSTECITKIGLFPEIERSWIAIDNKLVLWNYKVPQSSFNQSSQFLTIDQIRHTILTVKLVRPKPGVFVADVNYLLVVATTIDIHIFIVKYDAAFNNLEVFNPDLSVSAQGLIVNNFTVNPKTNDIYFSGEGDGINVWRLDYSNKSSFIKNKCDKICLTKSGLSSVIPNKLPGFDLFNSSEPAAADKTAALNNIPETLVQLEIDGERDVLYSLSNKSVIRVYKLQAKQEQLHEASKLTPNQIFKTASSLFVDTANIKVFERFKIISIQHISPQESSAVQLIGITSNGCRILLKLGSTSTFGSLISSSFNSSVNSSLRLNLATIKFPPSREVPVINPELDSFTRSKQYLAQLIANQQKSQLLKNTKIAKIISPGIFICVKKTKKSDKLFIATANYGFLKKNNKLVEDAEFYKYGANDDTSFTYIHDIIQLTPSMNASNTPNGYANVLASQYTKQPLRFAILTNFGIMFYQFKVSDQILKSLKEETIENFIEENGFEETCSTLLYLSCSYGHHNANDLFKRKAHILFSSCGNSARLIDNSQSQTLQNNALLPHQQQLANIGVTATDSHPTVDQVVLSDRFYGTCLLISRLFRDFWNKNVFVRLPHIKVNASGDVEVASIKEDNLLIKGLNIDKKQVEFFIGSIIVLIDFFLENGNSIQGLSAPNYSSDPSQFESEVCLRAEHIAFTSIIKSLNSMKEALSFLMVLIEEIQINQSNFNDIFRFLSLTNQVNLLSLSFKDLLLPNREVKNLIKDLLSSIINKNILKGGSIDLIASSLQGRCGSFCSTDDVLIFKAIENLTRAKNIGYRDGEIKNKCLKNAVILFEEAHESLTLENIENSINIMLDLEYYAGAVDLLLKLAHKVGRNSKITNPQFEQISGNGNIKNNAKAGQDNKKRLQLFHLVFEILTKVDLRAIKITETNNQLLINEFIEIRDSAYETCFASQDKAFHYEFYQWFIAQGVSERLLEINTPFILQFLEEKSEKSLPLSDLLWLYHAKRENYFDAATILYSLSISEFTLDLNQRIEYLSRANGFCNCVCPPNLRQKMIQLSSVIQELFDVANVQLDILTAISSDNRISAANKTLATSALNFKILSISDLFNTYTDPLGYYDLCLLIFKISDYKNTDDILKRWELFFERIFHEFLVKDKSQQEPFYVLVNKSFSLTGSKLSSNDLVFPIDELVKLISKYIQEAIEENPVTQRPPKGTIVDMFVKSGVSYDKLYYVFKSLIEHNTFEIYPGFTNDLKANEMTYLIKNWYTSDKKLRELIPSEKIRNLEDYSLEVDPISELVKNNGLLF
ncbi:nuclear pore complex subunit [Scheffersomyces xylosifermentans]|uniref:nuclear pore complex subunit n=1 Tax=Scheffersomyces xylosifermentans TaxID=1304137 RepID=UPI00315CB228